MRPPPFEGENAAGIIPRPNCMLRNTRGRNVRPASRDPLPLESSDAAATPGVSWATAATKLFGRSCTHRRERAGHCTPFDRSGALYATWVVPLWSFGDVGGFVGRVPSGCWCHGQCGGCVYSWGRCGRSCLSQKRMAKQCVKFKTRIPNGRDLDSRDDHTACVCGQVTTNNCSGRTREQISKGRGFDWLENQQTSPYGP